MITFTKEQLIASAHARIEFAEMMLAGELEPLKERTWSIELELARIALASLEAEPVAWLLSGGGAKNNVSFDSGNAYADPLREVTPLYTAPPAPVSVNITRDQIRDIFMRNGFTIKDGQTDLKDYVYAAADELVSLLKTQAPVADEDLLHMAASAIEDLLSNKDRYCAGVWADIPAKLRRAAMLQAGALTNEGTIPVTQFKPVADLYGLTSPTGSETSFTFDAVEARDFIDGGWSCQEYVELERFQEAITNHTEDKLAMVDHSGDSNNMVEPVTTANKLPFDQWLSQQTGTIDVECGCVMTEVFFHWLRVAYEAGNSPVIPDCSCRTCRPVIFSDSRFVVCPECGNKRCPHANDHRNACSGSNEPGQEGSAYPAAPQQEVAQALAKGMERYGDAMQELAKKEVK